jgi:putative flippase GtrA
MLKLLKLDIGRYFIISCIVSILDFIISYILFNITHINYLLACNIGIIIGFIIQYFISMKYIFMGNGFVNSFTIYLISFLLGIIIANGTMWVSFDIFKISFLISKGFSMAVPFFITYFIRKTLLKVRRY